MATTSSGRRGAKQEVVETMESILEGPPEEWIRAERESRSVVRASELEGEDGDEGDEVVEGRESEEEKEEHFFVGTTTTVRPSD